MSATTTRRIQRSLEGCRFKWSLGICLFEDGYSLDLFGFLIALPFLDRWRYDPHEIMESWRCYYMERSMWFCWGDKCKCFYMPWMLTHIKTEVRRPDGTWVKKVASYDRGEPDQREEFVFSYLYPLRNGETQERTATVYVERMEWRQRWLKWCPFFAKKRQSIEVEFSDEVGERSGSWKGGCIGCGYGMKPGESAEQTLRRMERERTFN
jgi:hypothetical protein